MKTTILLFFVLLMTVSRLVAQSTFIDEIPPIRDRGLIVHFVPFKSEYLIVEPVYVSAWLENTTNETQYYRAEEIQEYVVRDIVGESLKLRAAWFTYSYVVRPFVEGEGNGEWLALAPRQSTGRVFINVLEHYGDGLAYMNYVLPAGRYRMYSRNLLSDTVEISIKPPAQTEDIIVAEKLANFLGNEIAWATPSVAIPFYTELLNDYPRSAYVTRLLESLISWYTVGEEFRDSAKVQSYSLQLLAYEPKTPSVLEAIAHIDTALLGAEQRVRVNQQLIQVRNLFPTTLIKARADSLLKKVN